MSNFLARIMAILDTSQFEKDLKKLNNKKLKLSADGNSAETNVKNVSKSLDGAENSASKFGTTAKKAFSFGGIAGIASQSIRLINKAVADAVTDVKQLDKAITDLRVATGETYDYVSGLLRDYNTLAQSVGATTGEVASAADTWLRQGYSLADTNTLIRDSMILSKVGQLDSADAAKYLTSALKGYRLEAEDAISVIDKLSAVDIESATSVDGLAVALAKTAANSSMLGIEMEQLIGYLAAVGESGTDSMSTVGNAFQSIFNRMANIKLSKLKFVDEDGITQDLSNVETVLAGYGIKLRENANEFRDFGDVLDDIAVKWGSLTSVQQSSIAQVAAGSYQREKFIKLMENYGKAAQYTETALKSAGTAEKKFEAYLDSLEAKANSLQTAFESMAFNAISPEIIGNITDAATELVAFIDKTNLLKGSLAGLAVGASLKAFLTLKTGIANASIELNKFNTALQLVKSGNIGANEIERLAVLTKNLSDSQLKAVISSKNLTTEQRLSILTAQGLSTAEAQAALSAMGLATAEGTAAGATHTLSGALKGLWATLIANPLVLIATAVTGVVSVFTTLKQNAEQARQELIQTTRQAASSASQLSDEIAELTNKYIELSEAVKTDETAKDDLIETQNDLIQKLGLEAEKVDELIEKYGSLDSAIKQASLSQLQEAERDLRGNVNIESEELIEAAKPEKVTNKGLNHIITTWGEDNVDVNETALNALVDAGFISSGSFAARGMELHLPGMDLTSAEGISDAHARLGQMLDVVADTAGSNNEVYKALYAQYSKVDSAVTAYTDSVTALNTNLAQQAVLTATIGKELPSTEEEFKSFREGIIDAVTGLGTFAGTTDDVKSAVDSVLSSQSAFTGFYDSILKTTENTVGSTVSATDELLTKFRSTYSALKQAKEEFESDGAVSVDTYNQIIALGEDYADLFSFTTDGIKLESDALSTLADKLKTTTSAELAAAHADEATIRTINALSGSLAGYTESTEDALDSIADLIDIQKEMAEGTEYSTTQMIQLLDLYPELAGSIIQTANGYKVEEGAVQSLIQQKSKLLSVNESLLTQSRRLALDAVSNNDGRTSANVQSILSGHYAATGKAISSWEEYLPAWQEFFKAESIPDSFGDEYRAYVESAITDFNAAIMQEKLYAELVTGHYFDGFTPKKSDSTDETAFEKAYKYHQHLLAMDQERVSDYLSWLKTAYQASYASGEMALDDYYKYKEEVYEREKELFDDSVSDTEHRISLLINAPTDNSDEILQLYDDLQQKVHAQAEKYRAMGLDENDEAIQELQNQWWQYADEIAKKREEAFSKNIDDLKYGIETLKLNDGDSSEILSTYDNILKAIRSEIEYYTSIGYGESSEIIRDLTGQLNDTKEEIIDYINEVVEEANDILDGFEDAYSTITDAAKEYASTGALSADSLQSILELSPKYLSFLNDENGQLVLNKQALQDIIAAKTEEMAVENALAYSRQVLRAAQENDINSLITLTDVTKAGSNATWDMAYATLSLAKAIGTANGMDSGYFDSAADYVSKMQSLSRTAVSTISTYFSTLEEGYVSHADGLQTILDLTQDMIKWENEQLIDALEKEKEDYADIIDQKKELIQLAKEQDDREKSVAEKLEKMAKLQGQIAQLSLDDSREAQAQRRSLEEELADLQKELADEQSDYSFEVQEEALDKELEAFEKSKDDEIEALEDTLSSAEKLYQAAIDRIGNGWDELYSDLLDWNYEYGSTLEADLTAAWNSATEAVKRYGSFVEAVEGVKGDSILGDASIPIDDSYRGGKITSSESAYSIIDRMKKNSLDWFTASDAERKAIQADQRGLADEYEEIFGEKLTSKNGSWYRPGEDNPIYELTQEEVGKAIVDQMEKNAKAWHTADPVEQQMLAEENIRLKKILEDYLGVKITKTSGGVWMLGNKNLFDVYHTGGIVGGNETLKDKEILAKLEEGELVLDQSKKDVLYAKLAAQPLELMSDKFFRDRNIDMNAVNRLAAETNAQRLNMMRSGNGVKETVSAAPPTEERIVIQNMEVTAPVNVVKELTEDEIKKHAKQIGELSAAYIEEGFTKRGIKRTTSLF